MLQNIYDKLRRHKQHILQISVLLFAAYMLQLFSWDAACILHCQKWSSRNISHTCYNCRSYTRQHQQQNCQIYTEQSY